MIWSKSCRLLLLPSTHFKLGKAELSDLITQEIRVTLEAIVLVKMPDPMLGLEEANFCPCQILMNTQT